MNDHNLIDFSLDNTWEKALNAFFNQASWNEIQQKLSTQYQLGKIIYPPKEAIFKAFEHTPLPKLKVIILGQDPYHKQGQAMGLSFSVPMDQKIPPSLRNIFKELHADLNLNIPEHGDLSAWAKQGVLLLNAILTVEAGKAGSHKSIPWEQFTDFVIQTISTQTSGKVFLLWGNFAKKKKQLIDTNKHLVLEAAHPSPLARGAFFGSKHFSKTNQWLSNNGMKPINWELPPNENL